ncbi:MAG: Fe-S cluster assembly protein SufD [Actinomycetes bacterium]
MTATYTEREVTIVPAANRAERTASFDPAAFGVPTGREEEWRFTPLDRVRGLHESPRATGALEVVVDPDPAVVVTSLPGNDPRLRDGFTPSERVSATALAGVATATVISVPAGATAARPTWVTVTGSSLEPSFAHLQVRAEPGSSAVVVVDLRGSATLAENVVVHVADGARLVLVTLVDWAGGTVHLGYHYARLGRDAYLRHAVVTLGGDVVRLVPQVGFTGGHAEVELLGLYLADAGQHLEHRLFVDHAVAHCRSRVTYKGALQGEDAHTVWVGDVLIRAAAVGTDTYEMNRNLVLTDGARADSVPNLEIETGEIIGAGHASATGRFDDEQLFYLMSRGIDERSARALVVRGFFAEVITQIGVPEITDRLLAAVERELS